MVNTVMVTNDINLTPVLSNRSLFVLKQFPEALPSGLGSTDIFVFRKIVSSQSVMQQRRPFMLKQFPEPSPSRIGVEDLPGGFRCENILSGQATPLYNLARGRIQIDNVKVLFEATG